MRKFRWVAVATVGFCLTVASPILGYAGYLQLVGNIHTVEQGRLYRSATLSRERLEQLVDAKGIRTIVNLRGGEGSDWYRNEQDLAYERGLDFFSFSLSARRIPSQETMTEIAAILRDVPGPILIHCKSGRTGRGSWQRSTNTPSRASPWTRRTTSCPSPTVTFPGSAAAPRRWTRRSGDSRKRGRRPVASMSWPNGRRPRASRLTSHTKPT